MVGSDYRIDNNWQSGNGVIENSFLKVGDDAVKLFSSGLRVNNVVIWQQRCYTSLRLGALSLLHAMLRNSNQTDSWTPLRKVSLLCGDYAAPC